MFLRGRRYFSKSVEVTWNKSSRGEYDYVGKENKMESHTNRLMYPGMMRMNKNQITIFPFNFIPMHCTHGAHSPVCAAALRYRKLTSMCMNVADTYAAIREKHMVPGLEHDDE